MARSWTWKYPGLLAVVDSRTESARYSWNTLTLHRRKQLYNHLQVDNLRRGQWLQLILMRPASRWMHGNWLTTCNFGKVIGNLEAVKAIRKILHHTCLNVIVWERLLTVITGCYWSFRWLHLTVWSLYNKLPSSQLPTNTKNPSPTLRIVAFSTAHEHKTSCKRDTADHFNFALLDVKTHPTHRRSSLLSTMLYIRTATDQFLWSETVDNTSQALASWYQCITRLL